MIEKPLGHKAYGHIPHLPGSRMGPGDHKCSDGQLRICTDKARDKHDNIIVQEKLDGSNMSVAKINGDIVPLTRAGYRAETSNFEHQKAFASWVLRHYNRLRFNAVLVDGQRLCGEWLMQAHGTKYKLHHEPFVVFDLLTKMERMPFHKMEEQIYGFDFVRPHIISIGGPCSIERIKKEIKQSHHGAIDPVEGAVWRVERAAMVSPGKSRERKTVVDFLAKYVRPDKVDGIYLEKETGKGPVYNWRP